MATTGYARTNGQPSLTLTVTKTSDGNTVSVAEEVQAVLDDAQAAHSDTISITVVQDLSTFILESQDGLLREGGLGALFADPHDLPVPVQPALDARRRDQHPAVGPRRAGADAGRRHLAQRHDPRRPGGRGGPRGRRRDRRPREHLSP